MRFSTLCLPALVAVAALLPLAARGQFGDPDKQEMQMSSDPKAPGAAYVYLDRQDITDQPAGTHTLYERIKVLTEKGKERATIRVPYIPGFEKVPLIEARTIHADGTIIALTEKPADVVAVKSKEFQVDALVFTFPNVQVGSILEYRVTERFDGGAEAPGWSIQQHTLVHKAHYVYKAYQNFRMSYVARMGPGTKVEYDPKTFTYTLDVTDVPPIPEEEWMPPLNSTQWAVWFFVSHYPNRDAFWEAANKQWADAILNVVSPTGKLKKAAAELVSSTDSQYEKARKLYSAVMKLENTDYLPEKTKAERKKEKIKDINSIDDVWKQQRGSSDDLALLYIALCRAIGLDVSPMKVVDRNRAVFDQEFQSSGQFDDYIAVAELDGKEYYLDPGEKMCPFGMVDWRHAATSGFRLNGKSSIVTKVPALSSKSTTVQRIADVTIGPSGETHGLLRIVLSGQEALHWRQLTLQNDEGEVRKQFNDWVKSSLPEGAQGEFDHFLELENYESQLMAFVNISGTIGSSTGKRYFLPGLLFHGHASSFASLEERKAPVDIHFPVLVTDDVTVHAPAGYEVESGPQLSDISWPDHATLKINSSSQTDSIEVTRTFEYVFTMLNAKDYPKLHGFYQKVAIADQQQIVLTRTAKAKAN